MALAAVAAIAALPASASAAACPVVPGNATAWIGGSGSLHNDANWTNGTPSGTCDVSITAAGNYTVTMTGGANAKSFVLGGPGSTPHLVISDESPNTNLDAQPAGITIAAGASVTLTCQVGGCPGGGPDIYSGASPFSNAGTITVGPNTGGGAVVGGQITNTGTLDFEQSGSLSGKVTNQSLISIDDGVTATNSGSSCGDTGASVKNDSGGQIDVDGTGTLSVINYEQGAGTTSGPWPVQMPCGSLKYTGSGASRVRANGGFTLTGEMQADQSLYVSAASSNTIATLGGNFTNNGSISLTCPNGGCSGGPGGGAGFNVNDKDFVNAGSFTVDVDSGTGASVGANFEGTIVNTGTMQFDQSAGLGGPVTNKGAINIAEAETVTSSGSSCGDTGGFVKNDTGGSIVATGTGTLSVLNYEQGAGTTSGASPVNIPCGSLKYTGGGASTVQANGGFTLTGEMQAGQNLIVSAANSNTNAVLGGNFTGKGSITLTCPGGGCSGGAGGGVGFNVNDKDFVNAGTFTVAAASGTGGGLGANFEGTIVNTGTLQFDQSAYLGGPVTNKGKLNIADGKTATSSGSSCGDTGGFVKNDTGGSIVATGTGTLSVLNYEQGAGTTSGSAPVQIPCGSLKYTGTGAGTVQVNGGIGMTAASGIAAGQTLRILGSVNVPPLTSAGTIVLGPSATLNTGTLTSSGALTGTGTVNGSVDSSGVVAPGASAGTLTINNSYTQGAAGSLEIEVAGTGAGQFDKLAVGGNATLGGTLALEPIDGYADAAAIGDSLSFLTYGGTRTNPFATTASPSLACPKQIGAGYDDAGKAVKAVVSSTGVDCNPKPPPPPPPKPPLTEPVPDTKLGSHPKAVVKTKKAKASVSFKFSSNVAGATFQCKLDKGAFAACKAPKAYKVKPGKHKFQVRAVGPGGTDATPASFSFKVKKQS